MKNNFDEDVVKKPKFKRLKEVIICRHCNGEGTVDGYTCDHCNGYGDLYV